MSCTRLGVRQNTTDAIFCRAHLQSDYAVPFLPSVPILSFLPLVSFLPLFAFTTTLPKMKMTPVIQKFVANYDTAIGVTNVTASRPASIEFCFSVDCRHVPVLLMSSGKRSACLLEINYHELRFVFGSFRLSTSIRVDCGIEFLPG